MEDDLWEVGRLLDDGDSSRLNQLPQRELDDYLTGLIHRLDQDPYGLDADRLVSLGYSLHLAGWARIDRTLGALLAEQPTARRLDAVSLILGGLWRPGRTDRPVDPGVLEILIGTHRAVAAGGIDPDAEHSYRTTLGLARQAAEVTGDTATAARLADEERAQSGG